MPEQLEKQVIIDLIDEINESWLFNDFKVIESHLHPDVVFIKSGFSKTIQGVDSCINTYRQFIKHASVNRYAAKDVTVHFWGDIANAHYAFEMEYELKGEITRQRGVEVLNFTKVDGKWLVIWRSVANVKAVQAPTEVKDAPSM